ncbi:hypothetical protein NUW58_g521 [Xylaria curta]|uniref:Uncharacterized protein n=2 Tax=Xylaria curta TaxID=42375 RepID=A0ACC1PQ25_9PEZI|nr:hypothetical protein NUW58_g2200 [Xylaria curta]KAJ2997814.1 hypothetical protein NUW58_g521 [Xylaria curta]
MHPNDISGRFASSGDFSSSAYDCDTDLSCFDSLDLSTSLIPEGLPQDLPFLQEYPSPEQSPEQSIGQTGGATGVGQQGLQEPALKPKRKRENRYKNAPPSVLSYRERKDQRIKDLEVIINDLQQKNEVLTKAYENLKLEYWTLMAEQDAQFQQANVPWDPTLPPFGDRMVYYGNQTTNYPILITFLLGGTVAWYFLLRRHIRPLPDLNASESSPQPPSQTRGVTLCQVYPSESDATTDIDVIAIHGLDTDSPRTWTWKHQRPKQDVNWLEDPEMLPKMIPTARIFTCNWPADLFEQPDYEQKVIEEFARLLLAGIQNRPLAINEDPRRDNRPIVFIASCLGGIILMKTLVLATHNYRTVRHATGGIIFLATPFRGTSFQDVAAWAEPGLRAWASIRDKNVSNLLEYTKSTIQLGELVGDFTAFCLEEGLDKSVSTFYETGKTSLLRKIVPWLPTMWSQKKRLVDKPSAMLDIVPNPLPLDQPHARMNKFPHPKDAGYNLVAGEIKALLCRVHQRQPLERANMWMRDHCYSPENLKIQVGDMDRRPRQGKPPFSLYARLGVETPQEGMSIKLPALFKPHRQYNSRTRISRILIRGRAGRDIFDCVLWVPLRNLKLQERRLIAGYNFEHLFHHEYFAHLPEGTELARELWHVLKSTKRNRVLFVLDGFDEVSQDLGPDMNPDMFNFLNQLLNQSSVIITSRPNAILPQTVTRVHLELETIGFYPDQVASYIEKVFNDPETQSTDSRKSEEVQLFLNRHPLIQSLVRIPIQLDAFCYTWDTPCDRDTPETMTAVYRNIEQSLWKKDAINMGLGTQHQIYDAHPDEIRGIVKVELNLLEALAFTGMYDNVIDFEWRHRGSVSKHFGHLGQRSLLETTLGRVSFLRSSSSSSKSCERSYHFLHLTFQEYFGARYFVRQWKAQKLLKCLMFSDEKATDTDLAKFLGEYKYNARYDIFWRFVAGLLDMDMEAETVRLFQAIEAEPRDLLVHTHQRLVMHCLSEVSSKMPLRRELEGKLFQWIQFNRFVQTAYDLVSQMEFPVSLLTRIFRETPYTTKQVTATMLQDRQGLPPKILQYIKLYARDNEAVSKPMSCDMELEALEDYLLRLKKKSAESPKGNYGEVRRTASQSLKNQPTEVSESIQGTAKLLHNSKSEVRESALQVLQYQSNVPTDLLQDVAKLLKDSESKVRARALQVLGSQSALSGDIHQAMEECLKDESDIVIFETLKLLELPSTTSDELLRILADCLKDRSWKVRLMAVRKLKSQRPLSGRLILAVANLLQDKDTLVALEASEALELVHDLPKLSEILGDVPKISIDPERNGEGVVAGIQAILLQQNLSEKLFHVVATSLRIRNPLSGIESTMAKSLVIRGALTLTPDNYVTPLYEILVKIAVNEGLSWHVTGKDQSVVLLGHKEYRQGWSDEFAYFIRRAMKDLQVPLLGQEKLLRANPPVSKNL